MNFFFTLGMLFLSLNAFSGTIDFEVWVGPRLSNEILATYIEKGEMKTINSWQVSQCMNNLVSVGTFNKYEGTALKLVLKQYSELVKKPLTFKALDVKGCPKTKEYTILADVNVNAHTDNDINAYATVCAIPTLTSTFNQCLVAIDQIDNAYGSRPELSRFDKMKLILQVMIGSSSSGKGTNAN